MRMKNVFAFAAVAAISVCAAGSAFAQTSTSASQDVNLSATVNKYCQIGGSATPSALNKTVDIDPTTNNVVTTPITLSVTGVVCNTAADVTTTTTNGGVKGPANSNSTFANVIHYTGKAELGTVASTLDTSGTAAATTGTTTGAYSGDLAITVNPTANTKPLVGGSYSDTMKITIAPK
jgi:hypothetical protein